MNILGWFDDLMDKLALRTCTMNLSEDRAAVLRLRGRNWASQAWRRYRGDSALMLAKFEKYLSNKNYNAVERGYLWSVFNAYIDKKLKIELEKR